MKTRSGHPALLATAIMAVVLSSPTSNLAEGCSSAIFQTPKAIDLLYRAGSNGRSTVVIGDFNSDGKADVAVDANGLALTYGNGDGTFQKPVTASAPLVLGVAGVFGADLNGDAKLDLVQPGNALYSPNKSHVLLSNGDGTFAAHELRMYPTLAADLNGDGKPELIGQDPLLLGNNATTLELIGCKFINNEVVGGHGGPSAPYPAVGLRPPTGGGSGYGGAIYSSNGTIFA